MGLLSEIARRRIAAGLLVLAIVVGAMAVTNIGPFSDPPTVEDEVRGTVVDFFDDASRGDFKAYCDLLTKQQQLEIQANAARLLHGKTIGDCAAILDKFGKPLLNGKLRIRQVAVSGTLARVEANYPTPGTKGPQPKSILLQRSGDGSWKVSDPG